MSVQRGDLVTIVAPGDYGKPRPALIVQSDDFILLPSVIVVLLTSRIRGRGRLRITVGSDRESGLRRESDIMIDKLLTLPRTKIGERIGRLDATTMRAVDLALARILGLAGARAT